MKYMLLIYGNEQTWSSLAAADLDMLVRETNALQRELYETGEWLGAYGVADQAAAKVVRVVDGAAVVTDGPYLEAKEYIGSFDIIDCENEERALAIAARVPFSRFGAVEVRPLMHEAGVEM